MTFRVVSTREERLLERAIANAIEEKQLSSHSPWVKKVLQLHHVSQVHQGNIHHILDNAII